MRAACKRDAQNQGETGKKAGVEVTTKEAKRKHWKTKLIIYKNY